jgi:hypothetical protein
MRARIKLRVAQDLCLSSRTLIAWYAVQVELALAYVVMDASWQAAYDVRVSSSGSELNLTYYGVITNNSLDHWHDVRRPLS